MRYRSYLAGELDVSLALCSKLMVLFFQYYYYRKYHNFYHPPAEDRPATETTPLVNSSSSSAAKRPHSLSIAQELFRCAIGLLLVTGAGILTWYVTTRAGWSKHPTSPPGPGKLSVANLFYDDNDDDSPIEWKWDAQISGWASAFLYRECDSSLS
jgi:hypothetical protein